MNDDDYPHQEAELAGAEPDSAAPVTPAPVATVVPLARAPSPSFGDAEPVAPVQPGEAAATSQLEIVFEPVSMRLSLVYATLQYRLTLTPAHDRNAGQVLGDLISAHGSLPQEAQLAPALEDLPVLKPVVALSAGESRTVTGEVQLPLNAILQVRRGDAGYFVPLVRIAVTGEGETCERRVFTVGLPGEAGLSPLRADAGPQMFTGLAAREIDAGRLPASAPPAPSPFPTRQAS